MSIALQIKKLSILSFKRVFELNPYILILPKIFLTKSFSVAKYFYCLPYFFKYSKFSYNETTSNLISLFFKVKNDFFNSLKVSLPFLFGLKFKNIYFDSLALTYFNFISIENKKKFLIKIKSFFLLRHYR